MEQDPKRLLELVSEINRRKLDNHIREPGARVVSAEGDQLASLMSELKAALHEHNNRLRQMAVAKLANPLPPRSRPSQ